MHRDTSERQQHWPLNPEIGTSYFNSMLNDITKWIKT